MVNLKAVIPVAGLGMHMLPATKAIPKEMLPIVDKPMIQYIVDEVVAAGIKEIVLVTHSSKMPLRTTSTPLMSLKRCSNSVLSVNCWQKFSPSARQCVTIMNVRQAQPLGPTLYFVRASDRG